MKLLFTREWLKRTIENNPDEPSGLLACSPELIAIAELASGEKWDGTQEHAERLIVGPGRSFTGPVF